MKTTAMPPLPAEATAPKIGSEKAPWLPEQKAQKMYWLAQLVQLNYSPEAISPMIQVPKQTIYRWLDEPQGLALTDTVVQDSWAELCEKHNMHRQLVLMERADEWARVDSYLRHSTDFTTIEYARAARQRRHLERDLHQLSGGRWYPRILRGKKGEEINTLKDSLPQARQALPNYCGYMNAQEALMQEMEQANMAGQNPEGIPAPNAAQRVVQPDGTETLAPKLKRPLRQLANPSARQPTQQELHEMHQYLDSQYAAADAAGSHGNSHQNSHGSSHDGSHGNFHQNSHPMYHDGYQLKARPVPPAQSA